MRDGLKWLGLVGIVACASTGVNPATPRIERERVISPADGYDISFTRDPTAAKAVVEFAANRVWAALPGVYTAQGIPISGTDARLRRISGVISVRRSFAGRQLSSFVDCGTSLVGPNADSYAIRLSITTQADSTAVEASRVLSLVDASGMGSNGSTVRCSSTGELEELIVAQLKESLARGKGATDSKP